MLTPEQIDTFEREATSPQWPEWCSDDDARDRFARAIYAQALKDAAEVCELTALAWADMYSDTHPLAREFLTARTVILALGKE